MSDNVSVAIRVRPLNARERSNPGSGVEWRIENNVIAQVVNRTFKEDIFQGKTVPSSTYTFDHIFDEEADTVTVYNEVAKTIIDSTMNGINGTIFAYGQTSSGKTHTMKGNLQDNPGIIPLSVNDIFTYIEDHPEKEFLLRVSYMEIYNEVIRDLLNPSGKNLKIHENTEKGVYVGDLAEEIVTSPEQVLMLMENGEKNRHVGQTNMNALSSRSHTIFRMVVESRECDGSSDGEKENNKRPNTRVSRKSDGAVKVSLLNLVDLAGSERISHTGAEGMRKVEGGHINKSLLNLGTVIAKLSDSASSRTHIPYRNSKLTRILQPALGGNTKTSIICAVTPAPLHADETRSTLKFANRAKKIKNSPTVNEVLDDKAMLRRYHQKIKDLEQMRLQMEANNIEMMERLREQEREREEQDAKMGALKAFIITAPPKRAMPKQRSGRDVRRETWCPGKGDDIPFVFDDEDIGSSRRQSFARFEAPSQPPRLSASSSSSIAPSPSQSSPPRDCSSAEDDFDDERRAYQDQIDVLEADRSELLERVEQLSSKVSTLEEKEDIVQPLQLRLQQLEQELQHEREDKKREKDKQQESSENENDNEAETVSAEKYTELEQQLEALKEEMRDREEMADELQETLTVENAEMEKQLNETMLQWNQDREMLRELQAQGAGGEDPGKDIVQLRRELELSEASLRQATSTVEELKLALEEAHSQLTALEEKAERADELELELQKLQWDNELLVQQTEEASTAVKERDELQEELQQHQVEKEQLAEELRQMKEHSDEESVQLKNQHAEMEEKLSMLMKETSTMHAQLAESQEMALSACQRKEAVEEEIERIRSMLKEKESGLREAMDGVERLRKEKHEMKEESDQQLESIQSQYTTATDELEATRAVHEALRDEYEQMQASRNEMSETIATLQTQLEEVQQKYMKEAKKARQSFIVTKSNPVSKDFDRLKDQLEKAQNKNVQLSKSKSALVQEKATVERELKNLQRQSTVMEKEITKLQSSSGKAKEVSLQLNQTEKKLEQLSKEHEKLKNAHATLSSQAEDMKDVILQLQEDVREKSLVLDELQSEKNELIVQKESLEEDVKEWKQQVSRAEDESAELRNTLEESRKDMQEMKEKYDELEKELKRQVRETYDSMKEEMEFAKREMQEKIDQECMEKDAVEKLLGEIRLQHSKREEECVTERETLLKEKASLCEQLTEVQFKLEESKDEIAALLNTKSDLKQQLEEVVVARELAQSCIATLEEEKNACAAEMKDKMNEAEKWRTEMMNELSVAEERVRAVEVEKSECIEQITELNFQIEMNKSRLEEVNAECTSKEEEIVGKEREIRELQAAVSQVRSDLEFRISRAEEGNKLLAEEAETLRLKCEEMAIEGDKQQRRWEVKEQQWTDTLEERDQDIEELKTEWATKEKYQSELTADLRNELDDVVQEYQTRESEWEEKEQFLTKKLDTQQAMLEKLASRSDSASKDLSLEMKRREAQFTAEMERNNQAHQREVEKLKEEWGKKRKQYMTMMKDKRKEWELRKAKFSKQVQSMKADWANKQEEYQKTVEERAELRKTVEVLQKENESLQVIVLQTSDKKGDESNSIANSYKNQLKTLAKEFRSTQIELSRLEKENAALRSGKENTTSSGSAAVEGEKNGPENSIKQGLSSSNNTTQELRNRLNELTASVKRNRSAAPSGLQAPSSYQLKSRALSRVPFPDADVNEGMTPLVREQIAAWEQREERP